jgi:hypothetical protein
MVAKVPADGEESEDEERAVLMKWRRWRQMRRRRVSTMSEGKKLTSQTAFSDGKGRRGLKTYKARSFPGLREELQSQLVSLGLAILRSVDLRSRREDDLASGRGTGELSSRDWLARNKSLNVPLRSHPSTSTTGCRASSRWSGSPRSSG